ncbi:PIN domain-like protein, partial [Neoconidiobolus thromboides FSU 785]
MGINDLIPLLKPIQKPISLDKYRGKVVGVDGYIWLYKAVFSCAYEMGLGYRSPKFDSYLSKLLDMFDHFGVSPYFVFDGSDLPAKKCTNNKRDETRWDNIHKAKKFHEEGNRTEAENYFRKCIIISQEVAMGFIYILRERKVKYMVAPFEADAQLAYLAKTNQVDAVISEDSDLLVYECPTVIYKLNLQGEGIEINYKDIPTVPILGKQYSDPKKFRHLCILAGCDYLPNIRGIGLKKAIRYLKDSKTYLNAINGIRLSEKFEVPHNYEKEFYRADLTFQYQRVFDPRTNEMVHVNEPPLGFP